MQTRETLYRLEIIIAPDNAAISTLKNMGCQWDSHTRHWWIGRLHPNVDRVKAFVAVSGRTTFTRECERRRAANLTISVPFERRQFAKDHGGIWDAAHHQWLLPSPAAMELVRTKSLSSQDSASPLNFRGT